MVIKVQIRPNESLEAAMRRFKRQCNYSGIFRLAKANTWHEKRSDRRRRERRERLRTIQRATRLARQQASGRVPTKKRRIVKKGFGRMGSRDSRESSSASSGNYASGPSY